MEIEKPAVGFSPIFLVQKKGDLWQFLRRICKQTTLYLQAMPNTLNTADTSDSDTDTPFPPDTAVSSFSGSGLKRVYLDHLIPKLVNPGDRVQTALELPHLQNPREVQINYKKTLHRREFFP